jgi:hypothetical protein
MASFGCEVPQERVVTPEEPEEQMAPLTPREPVSPAAPGPLVAGDLPRDDPADEPGSLNGTVDEPGSLAGTVILVDVDDGNDERLYVIPESWARSELRSYATLQFARSYRDVLADDDAVQTVLEGLGRYLEDLEEDLDARELFERRVAEDAPFNAMEFFGDEGWRHWCPGGAQTTAQFLEGKAPALWSRFRQPDGGWGIDYDPVDYLAPADEQQIIAGLRALGCEIVRCPGLGRQYWGPDPDLVARIDAGEWPPRPGEPDPPRPS